MAFPGVRMDDIFEKDDRSETMKQAGILVIAIVLSASAAFAGEETSAAKAVDVTKLTCKQVMAGDDVGRESSLWFYQGYTAGKAGAKAVDLDKLTEVNAKVFDWCLSNPTASVLDAFAAATR